MVLSFCGGSGWRLGAAADETGRIGNSSGPAMCSPVVAWSHSDRSGGILSYSFAS